MGSMPPQSFASFMMRRVLCTTLFFIALLVAVFTATSVYYVVRINMIEKHLNARALKAAQAVKLNEATTPTALSPTDAPDLYEETAFLGHQFMSRATPAGHAALDNRLRRSDGPAYEDAYKLLSVGTPMSRQALRNPTLPESIPVWDVAEGGDVTAATTAAAAATAAGDGGDGQDVGPRVRVPHRQRYVLLGLQAGRQYMLRLSYLGSPSVTFEMLLYQVPQARLDAVLGTTDVLAAGGVRGWSTVPLDTELRVFATSTTNALQFDYEEEVWLDELDDGEDGEDDVATNEDAAGTRHSVLGGKGSAQRYVPVVEVRPRALSIPIDAARLPVVRFNVALEPLSSSFLPQVAVPLITYSAFVVVFVGYLCLYTFVSCGIAGGRPHAD